MNSRAFVSCAVLVLSSCEARKSAPTVTVSPRRAQYNKAVAAFPAADVATCTSGVEAPLLLLHKRSEPGVCASNRYGHEEPWFSYRVGAGDWQERKIDATRTLTLLQVTGEKHPQAAGSVLTPGFVEGRVVVFDADGVPQCQRPVRVEGPSSAWTDSKNSNKDAKRELCGLLSASVARLLAAAPDAAVP